jgi:hypothetical protein
MKTRLARFIVPAVLAAAIPAAAVVAQTQGQNAQPPARAAGPSADTMTRLQDGRIAMIREALKLDEAQLKLWAPVEEQLRAAHAARQDARAERRERRKERRAGENRASLPDRLDRASERMAKRAERMKAYADAVRPFYESLSDDQKAVARIVLRNGAGSGRFHRHRWAAHHGRHR